MMSTDQPLLGVSAAMAGSPPSRTILSAFLLVDRVALVTGAHRGIGLEMSLTLAEAGATVYCVDLLPQPDAEWLKVQTYAANLPDIAPGVKNKGRLEYISGDVTNQQQMWEIAERIVAKEGRLDVCIANAGIYNNRDCLEYPAEEFRKLMCVNVDGVLFTAQAASRQMVKLGIPGSIILTSSMAGSIASYGRQTVAYNSSKSAVLQLGRSMACELGSKSIRVNTISPGPIETQLLKNLFEQKPEMRKTFSEQNPLGRIARPDELRGAVLWLASEASTFCTGSNINIDGGHRAW